MTHSLMMMVSIEFLQRLESLSFVLHLGCQFLVEVEKDDTLEFL